MSSTGLFSKQEKLVLHGKLDFSFNPGNERIVYESIEGIFLIWSQLC